MRPVVERESRATDSFHELRGDVLRGWGKRRFMWQSGVSLQQELRAGMALNVGYFHTSHGNFVATANQALTPADFNQYLHYGAG